MSALKTILALTFVCLAITATGQDDRAPGRVLADQALKAADRWTTADHHYFEVLDQDFQSGREVTEACLSCHTEAAYQMQQTIHWTWIVPGDEEGVRGKGGKTLNNFCIHIGSNEPRCTSCHAGFGWKDKDFDFSDETAVDCLVCHEQTGSYKKFPKGAGNPVTETTMFDGKEYLPPEWAEVAMSVTRPTRQNCGNCHFFGGGGDGVKHGDLDSSLFEPDRALDVHMSHEGQDFDCQRCHTTHEHGIAGRMYDEPAHTSRASLLEADLGSRIMCESCHSDRPHKNHEKANDHTDKVACQACHIPEFARALPTKMWWDWSTAGEKGEDGKPKVVKGEDGKQSYNGKKGSFRWEKNVTPEYYWYDGTMSTVTLDDEIDPSGEVWLQKPQGGPGDSHARIMPFKVHRGKTPYDVGANRMVVPKLLGKKGTGAYWSDFDWNKSIAAGMDYMGLEFSGEHGFVETAYAYPTTHMVAPREQTLSCEECHRPEGRLAGITGIYLPGRDTVMWVEWLARLAVLGALLAVLCHGGYRLISRGRNGKEARHA